MSDSAALLGANSTWNRAWVVAGLQLRFPESDIRLFPRPIHPCRPEPSLRSHISRLFRTGLTQVLFDWPWAGNTATTTRANSHTVSEIKKARSALQAFQVTKPIMTPQLTPGRAIRQIRSIADPTTNCGAARACYAGELSRRSAGSI